MIPSNETIARNYLKTFWYRGTTPMIEHIQFNVFVKNMYIYLPWYDAKVNEGQQVNIKVQHQEGITIGLS